MTLQITDSPSFTKAARNTTKDEFDVLLATLRQEVRKKVDGLEQVKWSVPPGLDKVFKVRAPKPAPGEGLQNGNGGSRHKQSGQAFSRGGSIERSEAMPISQFTGGEKQRVTVWGEIVEVAWQNMA